MFGIGKLPALAKSGAKKASRPCANRTLFTVVAVFVVLGAVVFLLLICLFVCLFVFLARQEDTTADRKDLDLLRRTLTPLAKRLGYRVVMSLANYKYAGTAALIRCSLATPHNTTPHRATSHHTIP